MTLEQGLLIAIVVIPLGLVLANRLRVDVAAVLMAALLGICQLAGLGMLGAEASPALALRSIEGFSQPVVITLIALFILTHGLETSGVTGWLANQILRLGKNQEARLIVLLASITALMSLFMNNLAAGALVLPSAMHVSRKTGIRPSKLLIPVSFGSLLGGAATYFTTANIIMSDLLLIANPPQQPLNILDFTPTGGLIALAGIAFMGLMGRRLLPEREPVSEQMVARRSKHELDDLYHINERLWEARVLENSALINQPLAQSGLGHQYGVSVAGIRRAKARFAPVQADQVLRANDILLLIGHADKIARLVPLGLEVASGVHEGQPAMAGIAYLEVILAPHSHAEDKTLKAINFRQRYGLSVIAIKRFGRIYRTDIGDVPLRLGDSLLAVGKPENFRLLRTSPDFISFESLEEDQQVNRRQAALSIVLILAAIAASLAGVPIYLAMLAAAVLTLILRVFPLEETYRSVEWQAIFLIAGMYSVSLAAVQTGLAEVLGEAMVQSTTSLGPLGVAAGGYLLTALLSQFMGGQVAALVTGPITISAAISMGINPQAVAVATALGCSASFLTPVAHPVNILVVTPGNYKMSDFLRLGLPMMLISFVMLLIGLAIFWGL